MPKADAARLAHVAFGTSLGTAFPAIAERAPLPPPFVGLLCGATVYLVSYLGWIPALRLYPAPDEDTPSRTWLMVAAHLVWGGTLGLVEAQARRMRAETHT